MNKKCISVLNGIIVNNHFFAVDIDGWALIDYDINEDKISKIHALTSHEYDRDFFCSNVLFYEGSFYFFYRNCFRVKKYDLKKKEIITYGMKNQFMDSNSWISRIIVPEDEKILVFPGETDKNVWEFSTVTGEMILLKTVNEYLDGKFPDSKIIQSSRYGSYVLFEILNTSYLGVFNAKKRNCTYVNLENKTEIEKLYLEGNDANKQFFLLHQRRKLYVLSDGVIKELLLPEEIPLSTECVIKSYAETIFLYNNQDEFFYIFDGKTKNYELIPMPDEFQHVEEIRGWYGSYSSVIMVGELAYFFPFCCNGCVVLDMQSKTTRWIEVSYDIDEIRIMYQESFIHLEKNTSDLPQWIELMNKNFSKHIERGLSYRYKE